MPVLTLRVPRPAYPLIAWLFAVMIAFGAPADAAGDSLRVVIGRISEKPGEHFTRMRALADHLAAELEADGVTGVDVVLVDSLEEMRELMATGRVDIVSETAFMALSLVEAGVAELALREWKQGVPEYHSIFFTRADSDLRSIGELAGRTIAFEDSGSTSAYMVPRAVMELAGMELMPMVRSDDPVPGDRVGYVFAEGEINIVAWVHRGLVDAGVVSNLDWEDEEETPSFLKDDLSIIHRTPPIIRSLLLVRSDLDPDLKSRLTSVLQSMHETEAGRRALRRYFSVSRYDPIDETNMHTMGFVREILRHNERGNLER